ncbi:protein-tyrosine phosphatase-like protein [Polychytrium aggregatum]|uniref:protein-tyrosine phosphatase-like protein n=1 Tax=Polychytrium aggregatum TaxID=110093 RepID=UPI0022FF16C7|nr:protein-tyrosine phosphatase-like protein [Polychytrium aggregatum]KAI9190725.1 protein-tyrosine phosphatase-like protein [Polychytrium aggregatum]
MGSQATHQLLYSFESIPNFRDACGKFAKSGLVFRSATPDLGTQSDVDFITKNLGIKTIMDLRSSSEKVAEEPPLINQQFIQQRYRTNDQDRVRIKLDFTKALYLPVFASLPLRSKLSLVASVATARLDDAKRVALQDSAFNRDGLLGLNKVFITYCGHYIKRAFDILADERAHPILIHCSAGKDRTGLISALLLKVLGVSDQDVVSDYQLSEGNLVESGFMGNIVKEAGKFGVSEEFSKSPPEVMESTLAYIQSEYGGVPNYLSSIGVTPEIQNRIRSLLL